MKRFSLLFLLISFKLSASQEANEAFFYLHEGLLEKAKPLFTALESDPFPPLHNFGNLGLAKVLVEEKKFSEAQDLLKKMNPETLLPLELKSEWYYTQGEIEFQKKEFSRSIEWLEKALPKQEAPWKDKTLLLLARAHLHLGDLEKAEDYFQKIGHKDPLAFAQLSFEKGIFDEEIEAIFNTHISQAEKSYLHAEFLARKGEKKEALKLLEEQEFPCHDKQLFLLGTLYFEEQNFLESASYFQKLITLYPHSPLVPDSLYWLGRSNQNDLKHAFIQLYEQFPEHPLADEAYFHLYTPQEYLLGDRTSLKHLREFKNRYPGSPLLLHAYYLEGLEALRDRRSPEGKWLSRQNLSEAIEAFQQVETLFNEKHRAQVDLLPLKHQATLERGKTHFKVAEGAKEAKKAIYLDYAGRVFQTLLLEQPLSFPILEEASYYLALVELELGKKESALQAINTLLSLYEKQNQHEGYYLALALYQKGLLLHEIRLIDQALQAGSRYLSNDERLTLMIAKAEEHQKAGALDTAMLQLSEVANDHTASALRLKALYLRSEIYREQGRFLLAERQLESLALKGGEWGKRAKEQLEKYYE